MKWQITRTSPFSGKTNTIEVNISLEQYHAWRTGTPIQKAMPNLTPDEREFIITGITPEEWTEL